jgi:hypothetical protein
MSSIDDRAIVDTVLLKRGGGWEPIPFEEFFALPLSMRIRHLLENTVRFQCRGVEVDSRDAIDALRKAQAGRSK